MALVPIPIGEGSYQTRLQFAGNARFINAYLEQLGSHGKAPASAEAVPGLINKATLAGGAVRGLMTMEDTLFAIGGRVLYTIDPAFTATAVGGIASDGRCYLALNRQRPNPQVAIVCDGLVYVWQAGVVTRLNDPDLPPPIDVNFLDGYMLYLGVDGRFFGSAIDDATDIDALDFATAEKSPDGALRGAIRNREYWIFGGETTEIWQNTGGSGFPFARLTSLDIGCLSGASVASFNDTLVWIAPDKTVRLAQGYSPKVISSNAVSRDIARVTDPTSIVGWSYEDEGYAHYVMSSSLWTWEFQMHLETGHGAWHERKSAGLDRWVGEYGALFENKIICGHYNAGTLYQIDKDTHDEDGSDLIMTVQTPIVHAWPRRLEIASIHADFAAGVGLNAAAPNLDPQVSLQLSHDGGNTWRNELTKSLGQMGQYNTRQVWRRLGITNADGVTIKLSCSAAVARSLSGIAGDITALGA